MWRLQMPGVAALIVAMIGAWAMSAARGGPLAQLPASAPTSVASIAGRGTMANELAGVIPRDWVQWVMDLAPVVISLLALLFAWRSARSAAESAGAAAGIYETARRQYRASVRPHVTASLDTFQKHGTCNGIVVRNAGRGTAFDVSVSLTWVCHLHPAYALPEDEVGETNLAIRDLSPGDQEPVEYTNSVLGTYQSFWGSIVYRDLDHRVHTATLGEGATAWVVTEPNAADDQEPEGV